MNSARPAMIMAIASAEMRSTRRLARYWVFTVLATLAGIATFAQLTVMHGFFSHLSATVGSMSPRFTISGVGLYLTVMFLVGLIFIAYDIRSRDERERMSEVLDSRPVSNLEYLLGRGIGLVFMVWIPILFVTSCMQVFGYLAQALGWPIGEPIHWLSLLGFYVYTLTTLSLWCAIIMLSAVLIRFRILVAAFGLGLIGLQVWMLISLPLYISQLLSVMPSFDVASDLVPRFFREGEWIRFVMQLLLAGGCLGLAVALHPRAEGGSRRLRFGVSGALIVAAMGMLGLLQFQFQSDRNQQASWAALHAAQHDAPVVQINRVSGDVNISPGDELGLDLQYEATAISNHETIIFTLNPGIKPTAISVNGSPAQFSHEGGLLTVATNANRGEKLKLSIQAAGTPDPFFGYLDQTIDLLGGTIVQSQVGMLGYLVSIFDSDYVALLPGGYWMPLPGPGVPSSDPRTHPTPHFNVDISVSVPDGWLVAGPGKRETDGSRFRFHPTAPVTAFGLFAADFQRHAVEAAGVEFELLTHRGHGQSLGLFADTEEVLVAELEELFGDAARLGLPYPYGALSLVEIPNNLRGYGGGWRADSVQSLPATLLLRESSFPTARFERPFSNEEAVAEMEQGEGGLPAAKLEVISQFFENDFSGGNIFLGASRNFAYFQASATGEGAIALNFVVDELANLVLTGRHGYFSAHEFSTNGNVLIGETITQMASGQSDSIADSVMSAASDKPSVWDRALGTSLGSLEPGDNPRESLNVLAMKSRAIAQSILDGLGRERAAAVLSELLSRNRGKHYTEADFNAAAAAAGANVDELLGDWLNDAALPGFLVSTVTAVRLRDDETGTPRYQTTLHVRNDEPAPGLLYLRYKEAHKEARKEAEWDKTDPIRVNAMSSVEVGIVSVLPLSDLRLVPYLSLNRDEVELTFPKADAETQVAAEMLIGAQASNWRPRDTDDIVIDDLDDGFSVTGLPDVLPSQGPGVAAPDYDQGLPEFRSIFGIPAFWSRAALGQSFGKYRHTAAVVGAGDGEQTAVFSASLPHTGRWRLAIHIPEGLSKRKGKNAGPGQNLANPFAGALGAYSMALTAADDSTSEALEFDAAAAESGWNELGEFQMKGGTSRLEITNKTTGRAIVADAVRWRPVTRPN